MTPGVLQTMPERYDHMSAAFLKLFARGNIPALIPAEPSDWADQLAPIASPK